MSEDEFDNDGFDPNEVNKHQVFITNGGFWKICFEKDEDSDYIDVYQHYDTPNGEEQRVYCTSMGKEELVDYIYNITGLLDEF